MGIRAKFNKSVIDVALDHAVAEAHQLIIQHLAAVGEYAVNLARNHGNYKDQTGNLRASIGYVISYNGDVKLEQGFDPNAATQTKKRRDGVTGKSEGRQLAVEIASHTSGYALVVVAGMNYGKYVERRNYDVLTFTEAQAKEKANGLFREMFGAA